MDGKNCSLIDHFVGIEDPRVDRMKLHKLIDIIVIALCAMIAGCDTCDEFEIFGNSLSRRIYPTPVSRTYPTPPHECDCLIYFSHSSVNCFWHNSAT